MEQTAEMNSFNHYSLGSIGEWRYKYKSGIEVDESEGAGYKAIHIQLFGGLLSYVKSEYVSLYGLVKFEWRLSQNRIFLEVNIPANTKSEVVIPGKLCSVREMDQNEIIEINNFITRQTVTKKRLWDMFRRIHFFYQQ